MTLRRRWLVVTAGGLVGIGAWMVVNPMPGPPAPDPPGAFSFAALGDSPYNPPQAVQYRLVLDDIARHSLRSVVHVGDIFSEPCLDARYRQTLDEFNALPHPVVYTPGDNEWTDCWERGQLPLERLAFIRSTFFAEPDRSLGGRRIALEHQGESDGGAPLVENARWSHDGVVFATVHLVGSFNGLVPFPERTKADDDDAEERLAGAEEWVRSTFHTAEESGASAVVLAFHTNPGFEEPSVNRRRTVFERFVSAVHEEVERFGGPVLAVHGDWHAYVVDQPLVDASTGRRLENFTRLQVPGSPRVGWVRVTVSPESSRPFSFERRVIPAWRYW